MEQKESLKQSLVEMRQIQNGEIKGKTWDEFIIELNEDQVILDDQDEI